MKQAWLALASTGDPSSETLGSWPRIDHEKRTTMVLDLECRLENEPLESERKRLDDEVTVLAPKGGHNLWLTFRRPIDERLLFAEAMRNRVGFTPGRALRPEQSGSSSLRLSFPLLDEERLDEGVRRLAVAIRAVRRQTQAAVGWAAAPLSGFTM